jgi:mono/diheme cytochrome c family protein
MSLKKGFNVAAFVSSIVLAVAAGCQNPTAGFNPNASVSATYSSISASILNPACVNCHGGSGGYSFDNYSNTLKAVAKGNPGASPLYTAVNSGVMPKGGPALSSSQVTAIFNWIADSAKNN